MCVCVSVSLCVSVCLFLQTARLLGDDDECFSGLVGAIAGFAALGALIAYALYQAKLANMDMDMANTGRALGGGMDWRFLERLGESKMPGE